jgi:hypothetical protein
MRRSALPLALVGLLSSTALAAAPAEAYPNAFPRYGHNSYGPPPSRSYAPQPLNSYRYPYGYRDSYRSTDGNSFRANGGHGYAAPYGYPMAAEPVPYAPVPTRQCNVGTVLGGAAIGGGLGAVLASNSRNRVWSLPMGAAVGGILGGVISGC